MPGTYISQTDVELSYGSANVAQWSSFAQGVNPSADTTRIQRAIEWAEARADGMVRAGPYAVPITSTGGTGSPMEWKDTVSELAGWWLWKTRGMNQTAEVQRTMDERYTCAMRFLLSVRRGDLPLDAIPKYGRTNTPVVGK